MNTKEGVAKGKEKSRWSQGAGEIIVPKILADLESEPVSSNNLLKGKSPLIAQDSIIAFFHILKQNNRNDMIFKIHKSQFPIQNRNPKTTFTKCTNY